MHARCILLKKLTWCGLEKLTLLFGEDISKDDLIKNSSNAMINNKDNKIDLMLSLIGKEEEDEGVVLNC